MAWAADGTVRGDLDKDGLKHDVILSPTNFVYRVKPRNAATNYNGFTNMWNMGNIPLENILSVSKKVKLTKEDQDSLTVHYAAGVDGRDLAVNKVKFKGSAELCANIRNKLRSVVEANHPARKYLVLINPVSGKKQAKTIYHKKVEPIFSMCGIVTEVVVTERAKHVEEILQSRDMSGIQGIIAVGGDGFFSEVLTAWMVRTQVNYKVDYHDPDADLVTPPLPLGIIPAGSGDFIVEYLHGSRDPVTAAIHIVLGKTQSMNAASVFQGGQLCTYSSLLLSFGLIGDMMKDLEGHRWMGQARFSIIPPRTLMNRRMFDVELEYLTDDWHKAAYMLYGVDTQVITWRPDDNKMAPCFDDSALTVHLTSKCKLVQHMQQLKKVEQKAADCWDYNFVTELRVQGYRVRFPQTPMSMSPTGDTVLADTFYLNCDGDVITIDKPLFEVRFHPGIYTLFGGGSRDDTNNNSERTMESKSVAESNYSTETLAGSSIDTVSVPESNTELDSVVEEVESYNTEGITESHNSTENTESYTTRL